MRLTDIHHISVYAIYLFSRCGPKKKKYIYNKKIYIIKKNIYIYIQKGHSQFWKKSAEAYFSRNVYK